MEKVSIIYAELMRFTEPAGYKYGVYLSIQLEGNDLL